jgi:hypothetical protein
MKEKVAGYESTDNYHLNFKLQKGTINITYLHEMTEAKQCLV